MEANTLTTEQVAILRKAATNTKIGLRYWIAARYVNGTGFVTVGEEIDMGEGVEPRYVTRRTEIEATGSVENYDRREGIVAYYAAAQHYATSSISPLRTLASLVKPGDTLRVHFLIGNNTETLRSAELMQDEAYIIVQRKGKIVGDVFVDNVIAPANSTARMGGAL